MSTQSGNSVKPYDPNRTDADSHPHHSLYTKELSKEGQDRSNWLSDLIETGQKHTYLPRDQMRRVEKEYNNLYWAASTRVKLANSTVGELRSTITPAAACNMINHEDQNYFQNHPPASNAGSTGAPTTTSGSQEPTSKAKGPAVFGPPPPPSH